MQKITKKEYTALHAKFTTEHQGIITPIYADKVISVNGHDLLDDYMQVKSGKPLCHPCNQFSKIPIGYFAAGKVIDNNETLIVLAYSLCSPSEYCKFDAYTGKAMAMRKIVTYTKQSYFKPISLQVGTQTIDVIRPMVPVTNRTASNCHCGIEYSYYKQAYNPLSPFGSVYIFIKEHSPTAQMCKFYKRIIGYYKLQSQTEIEYDFTKAPLLFKSQPIYTFH